MKLKKRKPLTVLREILELMALNDPFGVAIDSGMTRKMLRIVAIFTLLDVYVNTSNHALIFYPVMNIS